MFDSQARPLTGRTKPRTPSRTGYTRRANSPLTIRRDVGNVRMPINPAKTSVSSSSGARISEAAKAAVRVAKVSRTVRSSIARRFAKSIEYVRIMPTAHAVMRTSGRGIGIFSQRNIVTTATVMSPTARTGM